MPETNNSHSNGISNLLSNSSAPTLNEIMNSKNKNELSALLGQSLISSNPVYIADFSMGSVYTLDSLNEFAEKGYQKKEKGSVLLKCVFKNNALKQD